MPGADQNNSVGAPYPQQHEPSSSCSEEYKHLIKSKYTDYVGTELLNAPVTAIVGTTNDAANALMSALGIDTIGELADSKLFKKAKSLAETARKQQAEIDAENAWLFDESVPMASPDDLEDDSAPTKPVLDATAVIDRSVIGVDDRVRVDPLGPYFEAICFLGMTAQNGRRVRGTGFYINYGGRAALLTAGHCLYSAQNGGYFRTVRIIRGRSGRSMPFGVKTVGSSALRVPEEWKTTRSHEHDWGIIILGGEPWGFGIQTMADQDLTGKIIRTAGYPGDKQGYMMWFDSGPVTQVQARKIYYQEDTAGGQSGSPVWAKVPGRNYWNAVGIHAYGVSRGLNANSATRITSNMLSQIAAWLN